MGIMDRTYEVRFLKESDFEEIIELGDIIFGDNYLSREELVSILDKSKKGNINCSFTLRLNEGDGSPLSLVGFRLTYAPGNWIDSYDLELHPEKWGYDPSKVAYMKSNALDEKVRGLGLGRLLLDKSIGECRRSGAVAGVAHIWMNSPGNSAFNYFSRAGGELVETYPSYWSHFHLEDNPCIICGPGCQCSASEMIIDFSTHEELKHV